MSSSDFEDGILRVVEWHDVIAWKQSHKEGARGFSRTGLAVLRREPDNRSDPWAVQPWREHGPIGYLPRDVAREVCRRLEAWRYLPIVRIRRIQRDGLQFLVGLPFKESEVTNNDQRETRRHILMRDWPEYGEPKY